MIHVFAAGGAIYLYLLYAWLLSAIISAEGADYTPTVSEFFLDMLLMNGTEIIGAWSRSMTGYRTPPDRGLCQVARQPTRCSKPSSS